MDPFHYSWIAVNDNSSLKQPILLIKTAQELYYRNKLVGMWKETMFSVSGLALKVGLF